MTDSSSPSLLKITALISIFALSAALMLWLYWRFPRVTGAITVVVLVALGISARRARSIDVDKKKLDDGKQSF